MPIPHRPRCSRLPTSRRLLLWTLLVTQVCLLGYLHLYRLALTRTRHSPVASSDTDRQQPSLSAASVARYVPRHTDRQQPSLSAASVARYVPRHTDRQQPSLSAAPVARYVPRQTYQQMVESSFVKRESDSRKSVKNDREKSSSFAQQPSLSAASVARYVPRQTYQQMVESSFVKRESDSRKSVKNDREKSSSFARQSPAAGDGEVLQQNLPSPGVNDAVNEVALSSFDNEDLTGTAKALPRKSRKADGRENKHFSNPLTGRSENNKRILRMFESFSHLRHASAPERKATVIRPLSDQKTARNAMRFWPYSNFPKATPDCEAILFSTEDEVLTLLKPTLTKRNFCDLLATMDAFTEAMTKAHIPFFMYGGTLIGSWRHHGIVPWDDDLDFAVSNYKRKQAYRALGALWPKFVLDITQRTRWKLYRNNAHKISQVSWRYPYLDISFYRQNASHVWDRDVKNFYMFIYPKHWIFPLTSRPFQGRWLPAPRDVKNTLNLTYNLTICQTGGYSHQMERSNDNLYYLPCKDLHGVVPLVERVGFVGGCRETLVLGDKALGHHFLQDTNC